MLSFLGIVGAVLLACCGVPQAVQSVTNGHSRGVSAAMLWAWWGGECLLLAYVLLGTCDAILVANYAANVGIVAVIIWFKYSPRG